MSIIKTRFAPSNTGQATMGSTKTAVLAYCYAKKNNGQFTIRIEDSDKTRSTKEYLIDILECLEWLGVKPDDAPSLQDIKADIYHEKYFQSKRGDIYNKYVDALITSGNAKVQPDNSVVFNMPQKGYMLDDLICGKVEFPTGSQEDFVIRRADGTCIFHLVNVVDDILEGHTILAKGADHLSNYPKHAALFEALATKPPLYAHMPLVMDAKGAKLSKRRSDQGAIISDLRKEGILPQAVVCMMGKLGWSNPAKEEIFGLEYMCKHFDLKDCSNINSRYDIVKLRNINSQMLKSMGKDELKQHLVAYGEKYYPQTTDAIVAANKFDVFVDMNLSRLKNLREAFDGCEWLVTTPEYSEENTKKVLAACNISILEKFKTKIANSEWSKDSIVKTMKDIVEESGIKMVGIAQQVRLATTGNLVSPPVDSVATYLGKDITIERISQFLNKAKQYE